MPENAPHAGGVSALRRPSPPPTRSGDTTHNVTFTGTSQHRFFAHFYRCGTIHTPSPAGAVTNCHRYSFSPAPVKPRWGGGEEPAEPPGGAAVPLEAGRGRERRRAGSARPCPPGGAGAPPACCRSPGAAAAPPFPLPPVPPRQRRLVKAVLFFHPAVDNEEILARAISGPRRSRALFPAGSQSSLFAFTDTKQLRSAQGNICLPVPQTIITFSCSPWEKGPLIPCQAAVLNPLPVSGWNRDKGRRFYWRGEKNK